MNNLLKTFVPPLLILGISLLFAFIWFRYGSIMGAGESGLPFYGLASQYRISKYSWADPGLGNGVGIGVASAPTYWVLSKMQEIGVTLPVIQASFFAIIFFVAGFSIYFLTKELFPSLSNKFVFLAVLFYWFNPLTMVNVWNRLLYNHMIFFALLPLIVFLFLQGLNKQSYRFAIFASLSTVFFSYALTSTVFIILILGVLFYVIAFFALFSEDSKVFLFKYLILFLLGFFVFNLWWITQLFGFIFSSGYTEITSSFFSSVGNLSTLTSISQRLGGLADVLGFLHADFFTNGPFWARIYVSNLVVLFEYLITSAILWTIYKFRKTKKVLFLGFLFLLTVFLVKGNGQPFGEVFQSVFIWLPPLQVFRNPFEKFGFLLPLAAAPLFSFFLARIKQGFLYPVTAVLLFVVWGFPFWTGLMFTYPKSTGPGTIKLVSYEVDPPNYYKEMDKWLKTQGNDFRFVSLPLGGEGVTYTWLKQYSGVESSSVLLSTPNISFNTTVPFYSGLVTGLSKYQLDPKILNFFPFMNSRFIVWRSDIDFKARNMPDPQVIRAKLNEWVKSGLLTKGYETGNLLAYQVVEKWFWPKIYSTADISISNSKDIAFLSAFFSGFPGKRTAFVDENNTSKDLVYKNEIYVPDKVYFQKVTAPLPKNLTDDQLLGKLFYANHLPGELIYPFIRLNEKILEVREKDIDGWMLYKVGILGKRVAEIYKLEKLGESTALIVSTQKDYERELSDMSPYIVDLIKRGGPVAGVAKDSLMFQWILLSRVGLSSTTTLLSDLLSKWDVKPTFELPQSGNTYVVGNFKLPVDGSYFLYGADRGDLFVDGKILATEKSKPIELKHGEHEVSLNLEDDQILKNVVNYSDDIFIDEKSQLHWDFEIPNLPKTYQVEFDYRFVSGTTFAVKIVQDIENEDSPLFNNNVGLSPNYYGWGHFSQEMNSSPGATKAYLTFSPLKAKVCGKLWWGWTKCDIGDSKFGVEIRNLKVREVDSPELALIINGTVSDDSIPTQTSFEEINPTFYKVHVDKKSTKPEILVLSELYNSSWKLSYQDGKPVPNDLHLLVNGYANGWVLSKEGSYDLTISFGPQKALEFGVKISRYSVFVIMMLLIADTLRRKINEKS